MHDSLTIALLQAREAAMTYFRPIVKSHNLTDQQWRIVRIPPIALYGFSRAGLSYLYFASKSDRNIDAHGAETDWCCDSSRLTISVSYMSC